MSASMGGHAAKPQRKVWAETGAVLPVRAVLSQMVFDELRVTTKGIPDTEDALLHSKPSPFEKLDLNCRAVVDASLADAQADAQAPASGGPPPPSTVERVVGSMLGMAVGDSVGAPLEFVPIGQRGAHYNARQHTWAGEQNAFDLKRGQWTDDASMGLCIADSLLAKGGYDGVDIRTRFWNWWNRGYNNAFKHDDERVVKTSVGLGGNISKSIYSLRLDEPPAPTYTPDAGGAGADDSGNGSLMRLAPIPCFYHNNLDDALAHARSCSWTTHPGPTAATCSEFWSFAIVAAINAEGGACNGGGGARAFLDGVADAFLRRVEAQGRTEEPGVGVVRRLLLANEPCDGTEACWNWRRPGMAGALQATLHARGSGYNGYPVSARYFGSYAVDALAMALHSIYHSATFEEAIVRCVNLLGDADSTGSICGQLAGAMYGVAAIPQDWVDDIQQWDNHGEIALRGVLLAAAAPPGKGNATGSEEQGTSQSASASAESAGNE